MFERFTKKARRTIFFGRYEASQLGSPYIETEHILLGLVREDPQLCRRFLPEEAKDQIREKIEAGAIRDIVSNIASGEISFDLSLADDSANFKLMKGGWASDNCVVCGWRLFESEILAHGSGYTNGRYWLCIECYEKFFREAQSGPPLHPDIT